MKTDETHSNGTYIPSLSGITVIKIMYKSKLSTIWLVKDENHGQDLFILKGKLKKEISQIDFEMLKRERIFYENNTKSYFPQFIKSHKDDSSLYMQLTFLEGTTLSSLLNDKILCFNKSVMPSDHSVYLYIASQVVHHLWDLHKECYIYRDLKMNNLLINASLSVSMIDFGFVKMLETGNERTSTICGTTHMMAPELLKTKYGKQADYGKEVDIYALGVLLYELFTGHPPFPYETEDVMAYAEMIYQGVSEDQHFGEYFFTSEDRKHCEEFVGNVISLIKGCMNVNPEERLTLPQIMSHSAFEGNYEDYFSKSKVDFNSKKSRELIDGIQFNGEFIKDYTQTTSEMERMNDLFDKFF